MEAVKIREAISVVLLLILDQVLAENVMYRIGQNQANILIDMIMFSKINAEMLTVGNLTIFQVLINVLMLIIQ
jgi:hypothetical protein